MAKTANFYLGAGTLVLVMTAAALAITEPFHIRKSPPPGLKALDEAGLIKIFWNADESPFRDAQDGVLRVRDGGKPSDYPLTRAALQAGGFDYRRVTDDVVLTVVLRRGGREEVAAVVRRGALPAPPPPAPVKPKPVARPKPPTDESAELP